MASVNTNKAGVIASLIIPVILFFWLLFSGTTVLSSAFTALSYWLLCYLGFAVFILPLHKWLQSKNRQSLWVLLVSGMLGGVVIVSVMYFAFSLMLGGRSNFNLQETFIGAVGGGIVAIAYCLLTGVVRLRSSGSSSKC